MSEHNGFYRKYSTFLLKQGEQSVDVAGIAGNSLHFYLLSIRVIIGEVDVDRAGLQQLTKSLTPKPLTYNVRVYGSLLNQKYQVPHSFNSLSLSAKISTTWCKSLLTTLETSTIYFHRKEININFYIPFHLAQLKPACNSLRHDLNGCYCGSVLLLSLILSLCTACQLYLLDCCASINQKVPRGVND